MSRKFFLLILIPALLLIGAYGFIRYSLIADSKQDREKFSTAARKTETSSSKKTSSLDLLTANAKAFLN
jgi:hypothetical protein